jgi:signal transduction histidine kinase
MDQRETESQRELMRRGEALKASEARFRDLIRQSADGILIVDRRGIVRHANPAAIRIFDRDGDALVGESFGFPLVVNATTEIEILRRGEAAAVVEMRVIESEWEGEPVFLTLIMRDVVARRRAEETVQRRAEELAALTRALERSNRELDQFAYVISHDLKAPLRGIANLSRWIAEDLGEDLPDGTSQQLELMRGRVQRMEAMIDDLLQYSRVGRVHLQPELVDVGQLLAGVVDLLPVPDGFTVEVGPGMPTLAAERLRLEQVFLNLIGNAIKHHDRPDGHVCISVRDDGEYYEFTVADDGPGIAPQYHEKVFIIFQTLAGLNKAEDTGIGLTLVKKIIESQGGTIHLDSEEGRGATFRFRWPKQPRQGG